MATDPKMLAFWRELIADARSGNERSFRFFLFLFTHPKSDPGELDADGKRIDEYMWHDVPGEVRQEIVDLLAARPFLRRGKKPAYDAASAGIIRSMYEWDISRHNPARMTKGQSRAALEKRFKKLKPSTLRDLLDQRKTYAAKKELKRVRRKT